MWLFEGQLVIKDYTRFLTEVDGVIIDGLTESRSHAVESEWQGRQEAQSLPG